MVDQQRHVYGSYEFSIHDQDLQLLRTNFPLSISGNLEAIGM